jgi:predicted RNA polymerase sigma factor
VELNRAVAVGRAFGPVAGLEVLHPLMQHPALCGYHLLPAVAGDLHCAAGNHSAAREHFLHSAALTANSQERATMQQRAAQCATHPAGPLPHRNSEPFDNRG